MSAAPTSGRHPGDFAVYSGLKFLSVFLISSSPDTRGTAPPTPTAAASLFVLLLFCFSQLTEIPIRVNIKTKPSRAATDLAHFTLSLPPGAQGRQQQPHSRAGYQQGTLPGPPAHTQYKIPALPSWEGWNRFLWLDRGFANSPFEKSFPGMQPTVKDKLYCPKTVRADTLKGKKTAWDLLPSPPHLSTFPSFPPSFLSFLAGWKVPAHEAGNNGGSSNLTWLRAKKEKVVTKRNIRPRNK